MYTYRGLIITSFLATMLVGTLVFHLIYPQEDPLSYKDPFAQERARNLKQGEDLNQSLGRVIENQNELEDLARRESHH